MLHEVGECRDLFQDADQRQRLEAIVTPLRNRAGITDEVIEREYRRMLAESKGDG